MSKRRQPIVPRPPGLEPELARIIEALARKAAREDLERERQERAGLEDDDQDK